MRLRGRPRTAEPHSESAVDVGPTKHLGYEGGDPASFGR
jgi:hypothetical protein